MSSLTDFEPVIGLEIHLQVKTKSKMFCSCSADYFGKEPNIHTCPTCLGLPGGLPVPNKKAVDLCIKLALAANCSINQETKFDRKNYFYPDLAKGYQISQYDQPIGYDGWIEIDMQDDSRRIRIIRIHIEEDTGKSIHEADGTLLDFNKSGIPLIEIVTQPDFENGTEAMLFAKELRRIVRYLDISDADMEKGSMRIEVNISSRVKGIKKLPDYKVEIKNIGSITAVGKAIDYEFKRQTELIMQGEKIEDQTRGWDESKEETVFQRGKESAADYRYFPEPDIPPIEIDDDWLNSIKSEILELPIEKKNRYKKDYDIDVQIGTVLTENKQIAVWFEKAVASIDRVSKSIEIEKIADRKYEKDIANWMISDILAYINKNQIDIENTKLKPEHIAQIVLLIGANKISGTVAKKVLNDVFETGHEPLDIITNQGLEQVSDASALTDIIKVVIDKNPNVVADYKSGKENAVQFLLGQVMRETKGKANPKVAIEELKKQLDK